MSDLPRVVVTGPMKCGSTYIAETLRRYLGAHFSNADVENYYFPGEQNLTPDLLGQLRGKSFVVQLHMPAHSPNVAALAAERISLLCLWRNLADVIVSFDDHVRRETEVNPIFYIADRERYLSLPADARYAHVIDSVVPWNLGFYLAWRRRGEPLFPYEVFVSWREGFFARLLGRLDVPFDAQRLDGALAPRGEFRFNAGVVGRAAQAFSAANRRRLERLVLDHPQRDELEILLWELPWQVPGLGSGSHDGAIVTSPGQPDLYFVSGGIRRLVSDPGWLGSRWNRPVHHVSPSELDALPFAERVV